LLDFDRALVGFQAISESEETFIKLLEQSVTAVTFYTMNR